MEKPKDIKISRFLNLKNPKMNSEISLFEELKNIKTGVFQNIISECRKAYSKNDKELYTNLKNQLPSVTYCGVFKNGRKLENLQNYNELMIIDIDKLTEAELISLKSKLSNDKYILALWKSPSGLGLKGLIKINSNINQHKEIFKSLSEYFLKNYQTEIDKSGSDITRLCFTSWDPEIHYNPKSITYNKPIIEKSSLTNNTEVKKQILKTYIYSSEVDRKEDLKLLSDIIAFLKLKNKSITHNYLNWRNVAFAISSSFSYEIGKDLFLQICRLDNQLHSEIKSTNLLNDCYGNLNYSGPKLTLKTVLHLAKEVGYKKSLKHLL